MSILSFRLVVSQNQRALHIVFPHQFLDSPEWFGVSTDDYFQVCLLKVLSVVLTKRLNIVDTCINIFIFTFYVSIIHQYIIFIYL